MSRCRAAQLVLLAVLASFALAACGDSEEGPQNFDAATTSTTSSSPLSIEQVEAELKQFKPEATAISCTQVEDGSFDCSAQLDGRDVLVNGTPTDDGVGFTFAGPAE